MRDDDSVFAVLWPRATEFVNAYYYKSKNLHKTSEIS